MSRATSLLHLHRVVAGGALTRPPRRTRPGDYRRRDRIIDWALALACAACLLVAALYGIGADLAAGLPPLGAG